MMEKTIAQWEDASSYTLPRHAVLGYRAEQIPTMDGTPPVVLLTVLAVGAVQDCAVYRAAVLAAQWNAGDFDAQKAMLDSVRYGGAKLREREAESLFALPGKHHWRR